MVYDISRLPQWNGSGHAAFTQNYTKGYDVNAPRIQNARRRAQALARCNGALCDGDSWIPVFVTDLSIDLALGGSTAQSRLTRDFYARNFTQPNFVIAGQSLDQREYGMMCEFIHMAQHKALASGSAALTQLMVKGWGYDGRHGGPQGVRRASKTVGNRNHRNQIIRGGHQTVLCQGYIQTIPRKHEVGVPAPEWQFGFVVSQMLSGPYREDTRGIIQQMSWVDLLKSVQTLDVNAALIAENKKNLEWARKNSTNIISSG